jgi:hypothetical protein
MESFSLVSLKADSRYEKYGYKKNELTLTEMVQTNIAPTLQLELYKFFMVKLA